MKQTDTPVIALLRHVWDCRNAGTAHSWNRVNYSMDAAMKLAINSGMEFEAADFSNMDCFRPGYWWGSDEFYYRMAVQTGNLSAVKAIEEFKSRPPFIADGVTLPSLRNCYSCRAGIRQRERLAVGCSFPWTSEIVTVTSFANDGTYLTACSYQARNEHRDKVKKRFTISRADIQADRKARKKSAKKEATP